jgi:hypothetical protein
MGDADPQAEVRELADAPVAPIRIAKSSAYGDKRVCSEASKDAGTCKDTEFHPGVDLLGKKGQQVTAPHDGWILYSGKVKAASRRFPGMFVGYEPNVVLLAHDDVRSSAWKRLAAATTPSWYPFGHITATDQAGAYSLIAHLGTVMFSRDLDSRLEEVIDSRAELDTANWRSSEYFHGHTGHIMTFQPGHGRALALNDFTNQQARYVLKGTPLGNIGDAGHVHWEIRTSPFGTLASATGRPFEQNQRLDPMLWLRDYKGPLGAPDIEENAEPSERGGDSGGLWLLLLIALASSDRRRRW